MNQYTNPFFGLSVEFPEGWTHRYWGNRKKAPKYPEKYQSSYDDLPVDEKHEKELFCSIRLIKGSPHIMSCHIAMAVFYRENGYDFCSERKVSDSEIVRKSGTVKLAGIEAKTLYIEYMSGPHTCYQYFAFWEHSPNIWINFACEGDTKENFHQAKSVFNTLKNLKVSVTNANTNDS